MLLYPFWVERKLRDDKSHTVVQELQKKGNASWDFTPCNDAILFPSLAMLQWLTGTERIYLTSKQRLITLYTHSLTPAAGIGFFFFFPSSRMRSLCLHWPAQGTSVSSVDNVLMITCTTWVTVTILCRIEAWLIDCMQESSCHQWMCAFVLVKHLLFNANCPGQTNVFRASLSTTNPARG